MRLALLAILLCLLAVPATASARIVPQKGIAGLRLGMSEAQVRAELGRPGRVQRGENDFGTFTRYVYSGRKIVVLFQLGGEVTSVYTSSRAERTSHGIGVGSSERRLRRHIRRLRCEMFGNDVRSCHIGRFEGGQVVTDFRIRRGRVANVTVGLVID